MIAFPYDLSHARFGDLQDDLQTLRKCQGLDLCEESRRVLDLRIDEVELELARRSESSWRRWEATEGLRLR